MVDDVETDDSMENLKFNDIKSDNSKDEDVDESVSVSNKNQSANDQKVKSEKGKQLQDIIMKSKTPMEHYANLNKEQQKNKMKIIDSMVLTKSKTF